MPTFADVRARADALLYQGHVLEALHVYCTLLRHDPTSFDARMRVADALLALGELQRAAVVYTVLARHATHAGHPLRALVALKVLTTLEPLLESMLDGLGQLYSRDSPRLGRGARVAADDRKPLPDGFALAPLPAREALVAEAQAMGADLQGAGNVYPDKLPPIPLFSELPRDAFSRVLVALKLRRARPGDVILREGEVGHGFFVLARGTVAVTRASLALASLHEGAIFGEMALLAASPRSATVTAQTDCDLLEFDRDALVAASRDVATIAAALDKFTRERLLNNLIATAPIFGSLDRQQRLDLVRRFSAHDVAPGVGIVQEGARGQGLYLLLSGEVAVQKAEEGSRVELARLGPGEVFGEMSLLDNRPASASVVALRQSTVLFLPGDVFRRLIEAVPEIGNYVRGLGEERAMDTRLLLDSLDAEDLYEVEP